jgi:hypothetical protein
MSSFELCDPEKLIYRDKIFAPKLEREQMRKKIEESSLGPEIKQLKARYELTLLRDGSVLVSGGGAPSTQLKILGKNNAARNVHELSIPRTEHSAVQLDDGRILLIGGRTTKEFADPDDDEYTSTVEELDLKTNSCTVIGRVNGARAGIIVEPLNGKDLLLVGGWHQNSIGDERWYRGAEIFRVPDKQLPADHRTFSK